jgi:hypothetical protein
MEHAGFVVEMDERVAPRVEDTGLRFLNALDLAQLAQHGQKFLQGFGFGTGHGDGLLQDNQRLRRL